MIMTTGRITFAIGTGTISVEPVPVVVIAVDDGVGKVLLVLVIMIEHFLYRRVCEDEDIRDSYSYCQRWSSADLCQKIDHCRCNSFDGDCYDPSAWGTTRLSVPNSVGGISNIRDGWSQWSSRDGWDGNDRGRDFFGSDRSWDSDYYDDDDDEYYYY